ncbi:hypothetical protein QDW19_gp19 [Microbacterium phage AvGardian]|nr:hypothetical protein QDW19_gp19 [Microbacterium phage AvGardian]QJD49834.1 hypothetical protein SEA_AVGARDIAN_19 [Microbacterium phage AvGardian]
MDTWFCAFRFDHQDQPVVVIDGEAYCQACAPEAPSKEGAA